MGSFWAGEHLGGGLFCRGAFGLGSFWKGASEGTIMSINNFFLMTS